MSNRLRFRSGQVELHKVRVNSDTVTCMVGRNLRRAG